MPKIKDLGINIIPGTMRPPEIGGGGGCGQTCGNSCQPTMDRSETDAAAPCPTALGCYAQGAARWGGFETEPPCGTNPTDFECPTAFGCAPYAPAQQVQGQHYRYETDILVNCPTAAPCFCHGCSFSPMQYVPQQLPTDPACTCITIPRPACPGGSRCTAGSLTVGITPNTPRLPAGALSREDVATLRAQLKQYMDNVDAAEKALLPKTLEGCDAREKELQAEMEQLKARRSELKK